MALFGKKKKSEQAAPPTEAQDEIQVVGGDASELEEQDNSGQVIDFDAIADELGDDDTSALGQSVSAGATNGAATAATSGDDFGSTANFGANSAALEADDGLDFDSVFDEGATAVAPQSASQTVENPFGADLNDASDFGAAPASGPIAIEPVSDAPPLTYTAPLLTSDAVATAGVPAARRSFPLPLLLGAIGLLVALGAVGYLVTKGNSTPDETPIVATNPPLRAPKPRGAGANAVNLGAAVDGVPIAPGAAGIAPALRGPQTMVAPAIMAQLKSLWKQGAAAKKRGDFAGARAAWKKMLQLQPNHPGVQSAIDKLPAA